MPKKIYISQPMRGRATYDILRERKQLIAEAASQYAIPILYGR